MEQGCVYWERKGIAKKPGRQCGKYTQEGKEYCPRHVLVVAYEAEQEQIGILKKKEAFRAKIEGRK